MPGTATAGRISFLPFCCNQAAAQNTANAGIPLFQAFSPIPVQGSTYCDCIKDGRKIEIIGWLYQYYISEKHDKVVDPLHGKVVVKNEVPAATQLFTTDWVVRYIIDNSVGRYWIERNPESNLKNELEYFVTPKDGIIPQVNEKITPEQLTVFEIKTQNLIQNKVA